jgi:seryl-tRNA(Sec) selenium transferase
MDSMVCQGVLEVAERPEAIEAALRAYFELQDTQDTTKQVARLKQELKRLDEKERAAVEAQIAGIQAGASIAAYAEVFNIAATSQQRCLHRNAPFSCSQAPGCRLLCVQDTMKVLSYLITASAM